jgi:hypothetical protein
LGAACGKQQGAPFSNVDLFVVVLEKHAQSAAVISSNIQLEMHRFLAVAQTQSTRELLAFAHPRIMS